MDKRTKHYLKEKLYEEREKIMSIKDKMKNIDEFGSMEEYYTELSFYDNHPADLGTEMFMMEQDKGLIDKLNNTLYEIEESIEELEKGNYGVCRLCEKKIDKERLKLIPYLKLCVDCANKKIPLDKKRQFRPEEEDVISSMNKNINENNLLDREDSYQEVARHNRIESDPSFNTGDDIGVYDEDNSGVVEEVEKISQQYYDNINK